MYKQNSLKPIAAALGTTFAVSLALSPVANAEQNPFSLTELAGGYMVADAHGGEGKCGEGKGEGEGKCGEGKKEGEGKCGEGKCGEKRKAHDGKCGEGKCGEGKEKKAEGSCGEGKGASEGSCGEKK
jgi:uncharacterized low-complexity protein